jgi:threonine/homoserine/homoserine lactone efflux protein
MASSLVQRNKVVAKRKGALAAATAVGAGVVAAAGAPLVAVLGLAGAVYLTWDWFSFRVKNGMRF